MRRRGRSIDYGQRPPVIPHDRGRSVGGYYTPPELQISDVPEAWCKHAREPWKVIFPDLEWKPPEIE